MKRRILMWVLGVSLGLPLAIEAVGSNATAPVAPAAPSVNQAPGQSLDNIIAIVNQQIITQSQFDRSLAAAKQQLTGTGAPMPPLDQLKQTVLQKLIDERLELDLADRYNIKASESEVDAMIARIAKDHNLSIPQLKAVVAKQGMNYPDFRAQIQRQITVNKVQQQALNGKVSVTAGDKEAALKAYQQRQPINQQYHIADFIVPLDSSANAAQKKQALVAAEAVKQQLAAKVAIDQIKAEYSDLGWRYLQELPDIFTSQVTGLSKGGIAGPILAPNGYHILQVLAVRGSAATPLTPDQLQQLAFQYRFQQEVTAWLTKARSTAYIKIVNPP